MTVQDASCYIIAFIGDKTATALLVSLSYNAANPAASVLPPGVNNPFKEHDRIKIMFDSGTRTLYVQLASPQSIADLAEARRNPGSCSQSLHHAIVEDRSSFQKAALQVLLTSHLAIWVQTGQTVEKDTIQQLRTLQAAWQSCQDTEAVMPGWRRTPSQGKNSLAESCHLFLGFCSSPGSEHRHPAELAKQSEAASLNLESASSTAGLYSLKQGTHIWLPNPESEPERVINEAFKSLQRSKSREPEGGQTANSLTNVPLHLMEARQGLRPVSLAAWTAHARSLGYYLLRHATEQLDRSQSKDIRLETAIKPILDFLACHGTHMQNFSASLCKRALEMGFSQYKKDLPASYTQAVHKAALAGAIHVLQAKARGPASIQLDTKLKQECEAFWQAGRQLCGAISLTGHPCKLPPHASALTPDAGSSRENRQQGGPHSSGIVHEIANVTGIDKEELPDPFDAEQANCPDIPNLPPGTEVQHVNVSIRLKGSEKRTVAKGWMTLITHKLHLKVTDELPSADGFEPNHKQLHSIPLPLRNIVEEAETVKKASTQQETLFSSQMDLEFPPLLATTQPKTLSKGGPLAIEGTQPKSDHQDSHAQKAYRAAILEGWPGHSWQQFGKEDKVNPDNSASPGSQRQGRNSRRQGRNWKQPSIASDQSPAQNSLNTAQDYVYAGFEYETFQGKRFFVAPELLDKKVTGVRALPWLLQRDLPLTLELPLRQQILQKGPKGGLPSSHGDASKESAQLRRVWCTTPDPPLSFAMEPRIQIKDETGQIFEFAPEKAVQLPAGKTSVLTLPRFYALPGTWTSALPHQDDHGKPSSLVLSVQSELQASELKAKMVAGSALFPI